MPSQQAYIVQGSWSEDSRKDRGLRFLESLADFFDGGEHGAWNDYYSSDYTGITPYGERHDSETWGEAAKSFYADRLSSWKHVPYTMISTESKDGFDIYMLCNLYGNLVKDHPDHQKVTDDQHKEWDVRIPFFYRLACVNSEGAASEGLKILHLQFMSDNKMVDDLVKARGVEVPDRKLPKAHKHHEHAQHLK